MARIFISHSVRDKELADALVDLLQTGIGIHPNDIFCSSLENLGIPPGENFINFIKNKLKGAETAILLLTPNYRHSIFCNCELGASWALGVNILPLLVPPLDYSAMKAVLTGIQAYKINNHSDLSELRDWIINQLNIENPIKTARWEVKRDQFIAKLNSFKFSEPVVEREKYSNLEEKYNEALENIKELEAQVKEMKAVIERLSKGETNIDDVLLDITKNDWEKFDKLISEAKEPLKEVKHIVREILYKYFKNESFKPYPVLLDPIDRDNLEDAIDRDLILKDFSDEEYRINIEHPLIKEIVEKLSHLELFLNQVSEEFMETYKRKYKHNPSLSSKDFWEEHLLL